MYGEITQKIKLKMNIMRGLEIGTNDNQNFFWITNGFKKLSLPNPVHPLYCSISVPFTIMHRIF